MMIKMVKKFMLLKYLPLILVFLDAKGTSNGAGLFNNIPEPPMEQPSTTSTVSVEKDPFEAIWRFY